MQNFSMITHFIGIRAKMFGLWAKTGYFVHENVWNVYFSQIKNSHLCFSLADDAALCW